MWQIIWAWLTPDKIIAIATVVYAGVTIVMFLAIKSQAKAAHRQAGLMEDIAQRQLRAYICVSRSQLKIGRGTLEAQIDIKNYGQTPAYEVRHWINKWIERHPLTVDLPEPPGTFQMSKSIIGPNDFHIMAGSWDIPVDLAIGSAQATVYIYGKVVYKDAFGVERHTNYRLMHGGPEPTGFGTKELVGKATVLLRPDTKGNDAN